ncbi:MAG: class I tRNA ligase family protein, partial [Anaerolineales bacterium]|nr:class I tRNA ligase family protein [Anaerolineales bacterium]
HDQRDFEFARKFGLEIIPVIQPEGQAPLSADTMTEAYIGPGTMVNSGPIDGTAVNSEKGRKNPSVAAAIDYVEKQRVGKESVNYRLRDWLISRQRYWGSPIPIVYKQDGTMETVPEDKLPVVLPEDVDFSPTGRSPLTYHEPFLNTTDREGNPAKRETDTMDTFMCSSWYQLRYLSPSYDQAPFDPEEAAYWLPVDTYTGGAEHATLHLMYTRFFTKAMRDLGMFNDAAEIAAAHGRDVETMFDEPMTMLRNQGQILGEERTGDIVAVSGRREGNKIYADRVEVIEAVGQAPADTVAGELMRRTENILHIVAGGEEIIVEVDDDAAVVVPAIAGENSVNQLKHHLEIQRMSKSKGNVVNPDELVAQYGADTVRGYIMFAFDWQRGGPWNSSGISGFTRFLYDVWDLATGTYEAKSEDESASRALRRQTHQTIQKVTTDMEAFSFNTAVAAMMALRNTIKEALRKGNVSQAAWDEAIDTILLLLAPVSPHITEELWAQRGNGYSIHQQDWPVADEEVAKDETITLIVQVNGKVRDRIEVAADISQDDAKAAALASENVQGHLGGKEPRKVIVVPGRLVNIVA